MNKYIKLNRIEFVVTDSCNGRCKHCSVGVRDGVSSVIDSEKAVQVIEHLSSVFSIESIMTFGGEPLIYPEIVTRIHKKAKDKNIAKRQLITNGYFSKDEKRIHQVADEIYQSGVNNIIISVDAFHQEYIPFEPVIMFAGILFEIDTSCVRISPAWIDSKESKNIYNDETTRLLRRFTDKGIPVDDGNIIFPAGNALVNLKEYFPEPCENILDLSCGDLPYTGRLDDVTSLSIDPDGNVKICSITIGNIYETDISEIVTRYNPEKDPLLSLILKEGIKGLKQYAITLEISVDLSEVYSACQACGIIIAAIKEYICSREI
ncbi:MAG: radical SAM protein [Oscillospiraceae bacterium]|nr:radical SAM protein [Oscillospiraceae bacterium]